MPHAKIALVLLVAFALPGAAEALGLGEIHVDSALNEPLAAEVEIVGATAEDLAGISASIANPEAFQRFGVERPAFLSTATFRIAMDAKGQPILAIRSKGSFTEPLINMLIDLRWRGGEVIRQYTLLLDPPRFPADTALAEAVPIDSGDMVAAPSAPEPFRETSQTASQVVPNHARASTRVAGPTPRETVKVAAGATLRAIASRASTRGDAGLEKLMIAIFRANPNAFDGNINRLRRGAEVTIPSPAEVSKISASDASHEFLVQMEAWHARGQAARPESISNASSTAADAAIRAPGSTVPDSDDAALDRRVQALQEGLDELQGTLRRQQDTLVGLQARVALADKARVTVTPPTVRSGHPVGASIAAILVLAAGLSALYAWRRRPSLEPAVSPAYVKVQDLGARQIAVRTAASQAAPVAQARRERLPDSEVVETLSPSHVPEAGGDALEHAVNRVSDTNAETTPLEAVRMTGTLEVPIAQRPVPDNKSSADGSDADTAKLQYRLLDLGGTVHHVPMPSILYEKAGFKERRTSLVDVLKVAVEREPNRRDLRMKLLETYHAAAATSRQGFLEVAQSLAGERGNMTDDEWGKILGMGRQIASDDDLFASDIARADEKLATFA